MSSGCLLAVLGHHYQSVTCIRFTADGTAFVSGGEDCLVLVWNMFEYVICLFDFPVFAYCLR